MNACVKFDMKIQQNLAVPVNLIIFIRCWFNKKKFTSHLPPSPPPQTQTLNLSRHQRFSSVKLQQSLWLSDNLWAYIAHRAQLVFFFGGNPSVIASYLTLGIVPQYTLSWWYSTEISKFNPLDKSTKYTFLDISASLKCNRASRVHKTITGRLAV